MELAAESRVNILEILRRPQSAKICAPMVRYSKLAFRTLVRQYGCDLAYTPMIIADSFLKSQQARDADFTTNPGDRPLIVQFAAHNPKDFADAVEMVLPYADGVDLNCGCPQRWAMQEGYGACLIDKPEFIADMVRQANNRVTVYPFTVSVKIRIHEDIRRTVDFCRQVESAGVSFLTVHSRTKKQRCEPVNLEATKLIKDSLSIPVVHNGDVCSLDDVLRISETTGADGVMAARGLLENPAMFAGHEVNEKVVQDWIDAAMSVGTPFQCFQHHIYTMLENNMPKTEKRIFKTLQSAPAVIDYLDRYYQL